MPEKLLQYIPLAALVISILALLVSFANLGWNMYRELALRGRLRVTFGVKEVYHATFPKPLTKTMVSAVNIGPGEVKVSMVIYKKAALWRRLLRRVEHGCIIYDFTEKLSGRLPCKLEVGDGVDLVFKYPDFTLDPGTTHVGLRDTFGRAHWAPRRDVRKFYRQFAKDFPNVVAKKKA